MNDNVLRAPWNRAWNTESGQPFNIVGQVDSNTCGLENLPPVKDLEIGITPLFLTSHVNSSPTHPQFRL